MDQLTSTFDYDSITLNRNRIFFLSNPLDEVIDKMLYLNVDRNLPLPVVAEMLHDLYQVETSTSALDRWKSGEAAALPSVGQLIQQLNEKKP